MNIDLEPLWLTAQLATVTTLILLVIAPPIAYAIAHSHGRLRALLETLVAMPLVLPPSVLGFYLLIALGPNHPLGRYLHENVGLSLIFSFTGLVIGSVLFSLPFMVQPLHTALRSLPAELSEASFTLGHSPLATFLHIQLPCIRPAFIAAAAMSFAHTVGEFGLVLMLGGNIPGVTRVASVALYSAFESLDYTSAHVYAAILCVFSFLTVWTVQRLLQNR